MASTSKRAAAAVTGGLVVALLLGWSSPAAAACAAPEVTVTPATAVAGQSVTVRGRYFADDCYDTGQSDPAPRSKGIELRFVQGSVTTQLGRVDADADYGFTTVVKIPAKAVPGPASVVAAAAATGEWTGAVTIAPTEARLAQTGPGHLPLLAGVLLAIAGATHRRAR